jgi:hypothetical protein
LGAFLKKLGLPYEGLKFGKDAYSWIAGENRFDFRDGLAALSKTTEGVDAGKLGRNLADMLERFGVTPDAMAGLIRDTEHAGGERYLSEYFDLMSPGEKFREVREALGGMMSKYVDGSLKPGSLPESLRDLFANRKEIYDWAKAGIEKDFDVRRLPKEYRTPEEIRGDEQIKADWPAQRRTDRIMDQIEVDPSGRGPVQMLDREARAGDGVYDLTGDEFLMLGSNFEIMVIYNEKGSGVYKNSGTRNNVEFLEEFAKPGYTLSHHHPETGSPPSTQDLRMIFKHADCTFRILARQEDGSIVVYELKANPDESFPGWRDENSADARNWETFYGDLLSDHEQTTKAGGKTNEAHLEALRLLLEGTGDRLNLRRGVFRRR